MTTLLRGEPVAEEIRRAVRADLATLDDHGVTPTLGTVLVSDDPAAVSFMDRKHEACESFGIGTRRIDLPPDAPAADCYDAVEELAGDPDVSAMFVQVPLPDRVSEAAVRDRVRPAKDVDCFAHENLGRLVAGDPRVLPATPAAILELFDAYDVETQGTDVVIVGRTTAICLPLANRLLAKGPSGDATVTVCHTKSRDLGAKTRQADVLVTAAGEPGLVGADMIAEGSVVVDVSVNRVPSTDAGGADDYEVVGDVAFDAVADRASAITPVPGGVGPLTLAMLLRNVVDLAADQAGVTDAAFD